MHVISVATIIIIVIDRATRRFKFFRTDISSINIPLGIDMLVGVGFVLLLWFRRCLYLPLLWQRRYCSSDQTWWWWCHHRRCCCCCTEESWTPTTTTWMLVNSSILLVSHILVLNHRRIVILFCFPPSFVVVTLLPTGAATPLVVSIDLGCTHESWTMTGLWMGI